MTAVKRKPGITLHRYAALFLSILLLAGCSSKTSGISASPGTDSPSAETVSAQSGTEAASPFSSLEELIDPGQADTMLPIAEALVRTYEEQGLSYDSQDNSYIWWTLYHAARLDTRPQTNESLPGELVLSETQLKCYLTAAFDGMSELPPIPEDTADLVRLEDSDGKYHFLVHDDVSAEARFSKAVRLVPGLYEFTLHFSYPDGTVSDYTLTAGDYSGADLPDQISFPFSFGQLQPAEYPCTDNC